MATYDIDPDGGGDYLSASAWEDARDGVLSEIETGRGQCTGGTADSTVLTFDGSTTTSSFYMRLWTDTAESYRHAGTLPTGNKYRNVGSSAYSHMISIADSYIVLEGLAVKNSDANGLYTILIDQGVVSGSCLAKILSCVVVGAKWASLGYGVNQVDGNLTIVNTIIYASALDGFKNSYAANGPPKSTVYNCVSCGNGGVGFDVYDDAASAIKNCYSGGNTGNDYAGKARTTCASEDSTGSVGLQSIAYSTSSGAYFTNITAGSENFHIGASSSLVGAATNLYNDGTYAFQIDIDGNDRGGAAASWDVGADEYVSAVSDLSINVADCVSQVIQIGGR